MFLAPLLPPVDVIHARFAAAALSLPLAFPESLLPAGYTKDNLPVGIEFIGKSFDDLRLLQVAYGYEQATKKRKSPQITPPLPGENFDY